MPAKGSFKYDWQGLFADFTNIKKKKPELELKEFCDERNLNYTNTSRQFAELYKLQTGDKLALLAPTAADKLGALLQSKDENIKHKTATAILDRAGHSPQAQIINIQQNNQANLAASFTIAPMFADQQDNDDLKILLGGE